MSGPPEREIGPPPNPPGRHGVALIAGLLSFSWAIAGYLEGNLRLAALGAGVFAVAVWVLSHPAKASRSASDVRTVSVPTPRRPRRVQPIAVRPRQPEPRVRSGPPPARRAALAIVVGGPVALLCVCAGVAVGPALPDAFRNWRDLRAEQANELSRRAVLAYDLTGCDGVSRRVRGRGPVYGSYQVKFLTTFAYDAPCAVVHDGTRRDLIVVGTEDGRVVYLASAP